MTDLITPDLVRLDAALGDTKQAVIRSLADIVAEAGRSHDAEQLAADALAREDASATGLPGGIAIPHCRTAGVQDSTLAFARLEPAEHDRERFTVLGEHAARGPPHTAGV